MESAVLPVLEVITLLPFLYSWSKGVKTSLNQEEGNGLLEGIATNLQSSLIYYSPIEAGVTG